MFWDFAGWRNKLWCVWHVCRWTKSKHHQSNSYPKAHVADVRWSLAKWQQMNRPFCPAMAFTQNWCTSTLPVWDHKFGTRLGRFKTVQSCRLHRHFVWLLTTFVFQISIDQNCCKLSIGKEIFQDCSYKHGTIKSISVGSVGYALQSLINTLVRSDSNTQLYPFCFYPSASFQSFHQCAPSTPILAPTCARRW